MIKVVYSTQHWIVPRIVMVILAVLLVAIIVTEGMARVKNGGAFLAKPGRFFKKDCDHVKLWGTLVLFAVVPFNILKGTIVSVVTVLLYKHISPLLKGNSR